MPIIYLLNPENELQVGMCGSVQESNYDSNYDYNL